MATGERLGNRSWTLGRKIGGGQDGGSAKAFTRERKRVGSIYSADLEITRIRGLDVAPKVRSAFG